MQFCILAKALLSLSGFFFSLTHPAWPLVVRAFVVGVLPIWGEVAASFLLKVEPARERSRKWLLSDAIADALAFLVVPSLWFWLVASQHSWYLAATLLFFVAAGIWRIIRFLRFGLDASGYFQG